MKFLTVFFALLIGVCAAAWAQQKGPAAGKDLYAKDPQADIRPSRLGGLDKGAL